MRICNAYHKLNNLRIELVRAFRRARLRAKEGVDVGAHTIVDAGTYVQVIKGASLSVGAHCTLRSSQSGYHAGMPFPTGILVNLCGASVSIGDHTRINGAYVHAHKRIEIGKNCVIAAGVNIIDSNGHELLSSNRTAGRDEAVEIVLGDNVWLGLNSIILKGTRIGENSVVTAGSVVKGEFPRNSLISGNLAQKVGELDIP
jgi:acetyltransferase-like isoleucine patch superfamily enzyme